MDGYPGQSMSIADLSDDEALLRAGQGNSEAFGVLYERYLPRIYNYVYYRTGNPHEAEDLTARVFQRAISNINRYQNKGVPFSAWLYRIAHNLVANWHRDRNRRQEVSLEETIEWHPSGEMPETHLVASQELEALLKVIRRMPPERQQLLILKFVESLSNAEVGMIMRRSEGAVKSLYHRTLLALRDELEKQK